MVEVNGTTVDHGVGQNKVILEDATFTPAMDNLVEVKYNGTLLTRHVIRAQRRLDKPLVEVCASTAGRALRHSVGTFSCSVYRWCNAEAHGTQQKLKSARKSRFQNIAKIMLLYLCKFLDDITLR